MIKGFIILAFAAALGTAFGQNSGNAIQGNGANENFAPDPGVLQELSPPQRPGRRGGVYITGAAPAGNTNYALQSGGTGSGVRTNTGAGTSRGNSPMVVTNNGVVATNYVPVPGELLYPPPVSGPFSTLPSVGGKRSTTSTATTDANLSGGSISATAPLTVPAAPPPPITTAPGPGIPAGSTPPGANPSNQSPPGVPPPIISPPAPRSNGSR